MNAAMASAHDIEAIVNRHQSEIWWHLRSLGCDASLADDLTQETFVTTLTHPPEQRSAGETAAWLRKVARNLFLMHLRKHGREHDARNTDIEAAETAWQELSPVEHEDEVKDILRRCMETLNEQARLTVTLRFAQGQERDAIAAKLGMSAVGVTKILQRAKAALRECMERKLG